MTGDRIELTVVWNGETFVWSEKLPEVVYDSHGLMSSIAAIRPAVERMLAQFGLAFSKPNRIYEEGGG
jgi:hypothetical protein